MFGCISADVSVKSEATTFTRTLHHSTYLSPICSKTHQIETSENTQLGDETVDLGDNPVAINHRMPALLRMFLVICVTIFYVCARRPSPLPRLQHPLRTRKILQVVDVDGVLGRHDEPDLVVVEARVGGDGPRESCSRSWAVRPSA